MCSFQRAQRDWRREPKNSLVARRVQIQLKIYLAKVSLGFLFPIEKEFDAAFRWMSFQCCRNKTNIIKRLEQQLHPL